MHEVGAASEAGDFTSDSVRDALRRARSAAIGDPHFPASPAVPSDASLRGLKGAIWRE